MNDLSPRTKAALAVYRDTPALADEARNRLWSRLEASVAAAEVGAEPESAPVVRLDVARTALRMGIALAAAAAILLLLRAIDWQAVAGSEDADARSQAVYGAKDDPEGGVASSPASEAAVERSAQNSGAAPSPQTTDLQPEPGTPEPGAAPTDDVPSTPPPAPRRPPPTPNAADEDASTDTLMEEMRLMGRVTQALDANDPAKALAALDTHARQHPHGQMAEDRAALRPQALCAAGRNTEAASAARRFLRAYGSSAHRSRVRSVADAAAEKKCPIP